MQATVKWLEGMRFSATADSGTTLVLDGDNDNTQDPTPMEAVLFALGSCSSIDVVEILERGRQQVSDVETVLNSERAEQPPRVFTKIHLEFRVTGKGLNDNKVARAVEMSMDKYCSVAKMLETKVELSSSYQIIEADS
jgi:putative redox protein